MRLLGTDTVPEAVDRPWARQVYSVKDGRTIQTTTEDPILKVYAEASRFLLVLGEPGSGKTVTLLELTRDPRNRCSTSSTTCLSVRRSSQVELTKTCTEGTRRVSAVMRAADVIAMLNPLGPTGAYV
jgi:stage III sporulation protein SpoIIIAA